MSIKRTLRTTLTAIAAAAAANLATLPANADTSEQAAVTLYRSYDWQPVDGGLTQRCTDEYYFFDRDGDGVMDDLYVLLDSSGHGTGQSWNIPIYTCRDWPLEHNPYALRPRLHDYTKGAYDVILQKLEREYEKQEMEYETRGCNPDRQTSKLGGFEYRTEAAKAATRERNSARR